MQLEAQRLVAEWLADGTTGVNAKLAVLTYDGSDTQPANIATITAAADDENAALERFDGMTLPAIIVAPRDIEHRDPDWTQPNTGVWGGVTLVIRYAERTVSGKKALQNGAYVTRAIIAALREAHVGSEASRKKNNVYLAACEALREPGLYERAGDAWLISAVEVRYQTEDIAAMGT